MSKKRLFSQIFLFALALIYKTFYGLDGRNFGGYSLLQIKSSCSRSCSSSSSSPSPCCRLLRNLLCCNSGDYYVGDEDGAGDSIVNPYGDGSRWVPVGEGQSSGVEGLRVDFGGGNTGVQSVGGMYGNSGNEGPGGRGNPVSFPGSTSEAREDSSNGEEESDLGDSKCSCSCRCTSSSRSSGVHPNPYMDYEGQGQGSTEPGRPLFPRPSTRAVPLATSSLSPSPPP
ncbi:hypothetical protein HWI79_3746, partial [Cryptosporidium felis]